MVQGRIHVNKMSAILTTNAELLYWLRRQLLIEKATRTVMSNGSKRNKSGLSLRGFRVTLKHGNPFGHAIQEKKETLNQILRRRREWLKKNATRRHCHCHEF